MERAWTLVCRSRKRRVVSQFEDLQACYLKLRKQNPDKGSSMANGKMANGHASGEAATQLPLLLTSWPARLAACWYQVCLHSQSRSHLLGQNAEHLDTRGHLSLVLAVKETVSACHSPVSSKGPM